MIFQSELQKALLTHADNIAIINGQRQISYAGLRRAADRVTAFLAAKGMGTEETIGIIMEDRTDIVITMIGILNARCVFVPIDPSLPERRLAAMIRDLNLGAVISSHHVALPDTISTELKPLFYFIEDILPVDGNSVLQYPAYHEEDSIYIYYTSGSTGQPKGIVGKNAALLQFIQWEIHTFDIAGNTNFSQFISPYFDAYLRDIFVPLFTGGTIHIPPEMNTLFIPGNLIQWIEGAEINFIHCVPSVLRVLNNSPLSSGRLKSLLYILLSGERIVPSELINWYSVFQSRIQLVNLYGLTETTMIRSYYKIRPDDVTQTRIPIGVPIWDTNLLILDEHLKPCPTLVPGDLYISSQYMAKGYLNDPALTHERFMKIRMGAADEITAFKTGDKARRLTDGNIDLIGREDGLIKLRGIRIELGEIENAILTCSAVKGVVLMKQNDEGEDGSIIAFVTRHPSANEDLSIENTVIQHVREHLPAYMIPSRVMEIKEFPLLCNGKVDKRSLLENIDRHNMVAPEDEMEERILSTWKEILGEKPVSVLDSFHSLGGNSISIMRLIGKLYKIFNVRVSLNDLFNNPTIRQQAALIRRLSQDDSMKITKCPIKASYHLSVVQERLYYHYEINRNSTSFNLPMCFKLSGEIDKEKIKNALMALVRRHESLRTAFRFMNDRVYQIVEEEPCLLIEDISTGSLPVETAMAAFIRPFDLDKAPVIRCAIISGQNEKVLAIDMHHIVCDGISQSILLSDFINIYNNRPLKPLEVQYKDYAEWEKEFRLTNRYSAHREFWLKCLEGDLPELKLPTTEAHPGEISDEGDNINFQIRSAELQSLLDLAVKEGYTTFSLLFSIYSIFLSQLSGQDDIIIGTNASGRLQDELDGVVGMFTKTLPIRCRIYPATGFRTFTKQMHKYLVDASSHQGYDLSDILAELNNGREARVKDIFKTMFVSLHFDNGVPEEAEVLFSRYEFKNPTAKYPVTLFWEEVPGAFNFRLEYSTMYFTKADAEILIEQFRSLMIKIAGDPDGKISDYIADGHTYLEFDKDSIVFNL